MMGDVVQAFSRCVQIGQPVIVKNTSASDPHGCSQTAHGSKGTATVTVCPLAPTRDDAIHTLVGQLLLSLRLFSAVLLLMLVFDPQPCNVQFFPHIFVFEILLHGLLD